MTVVFPAFTLTLLDVRTDDAARQPAAPLPHAPTPAAAPADSPACPSPATSAFDSGDNYSRNNFGCRHNDASLKTITSSRHSRRIVPITRSMYVRFAGHTRFEDREPACLR